ncbi:MAG: ABC transporter ATP-binding protein [Vampirovibrionales bacterium]
MPDSSHPIFSETSKLRTTEQWVLLKRMLAYYKPYLKVALLTLLLSTLVGTMEGLMPLGAKLYLELVNDHFQTIPYWPHSFPALDKKAILWSIPLGIMLFTSLQGGLAYLAQYLNTWVAQHVTRDLKQDVFQKLLRAEQGFFDTTNAGILMNRAHSDADTACLTLLDQLRLAVIRGMTAFTQVTIMVIISWKLALMALIVLGGVAIPLQYVRKRLKHLSHQILQTAGNTTNVFVELQQGMKLIRCFQLEGWLVTRYGMTLQKMMSLILRGAKATGLVTPSSHVFAGLGVGMVLWFGSQLIQTGELSVPNFSAFLGSIVLLYTPVKTLSHTSTQFYNAVLAIERLCRILDYTSPVLQQEAQCPPETTFPDLSQAPIHFKEVCFTYPQAQVAALQSITLTLQPHTTVALVGASGCGKTTFANLLTRFYEPSSGMVCLGDMPLTHYGLEAWQSQIAYVFQENVLFEATLRENLALGTTYSDDTLWEVLRACKLDTLVQSWEQTLDTPLTPTSVSGGQKQRIAIARALLANRPIVILDEATSALDNVSEKAVQEALHVLTRERTVVVIAHRLTTIQHADHILVFDNPEGQGGGVVEQGTHASLMDKKGVYHRLYTIASSGALGSDSRS